VRWTGGKAGKNPEKRVFWEKLKMWGLMGDVRGEWCCKDGIPRGLTYSGL